MLCKFKGSRKFYTRFTAPNGKRICRSTGTEDKRLAQEYEANLKERLWRAERFGHVQRKWEEAVVAYSLGKKVSAWHLGILDPYCRGRFIDSLSDVRDRVVKDRLADGVANSTVNRTLEVFRAVLKAAERKGWGAMPQVEMLPEPPARVRWISSEEAERLLVALPVHLRRMAKFAIVTGLREENIASLEWSRVDLQRRVAWVDAVDTKTEVAYHVSLNDDAVEVIRECLGHHLRWVFTFEGWRWKRVNGKRIQVFERNRVNKINTKAWRKALKRAGIENFRVHDLRHTWASWHAMAGTPLQVIKELGGWKSVSMVMKYSHLAKSHVANFANNVSLGKVSVGDDMVKVAKDA